MDEPLEVDPSEVDPSEVDPSEVDPEGEPPDVPSDVVPPVVDPTVVVPLVEVLGAVGSLDVDGSKVGVPDVDSFGAVGSIVDEGSAVSPGGGEVSPGVGEMVPDGGADGATEPVGDEVAGAVGDAVVVGIGAGLVGIDDCHYLVRIFLELTADLSQRHVSPFDLGSVAGDVGPEVFEGIYGLGGQRLVERDEQLPRQRVGQAVDALVIEGASQVLRHRHVVICVVHVDDEDHLVGDCDGGARVA